MGLLLADAARVLRLLCLSLRWGLCLLFGRCTTGVAIRRICEGMGVTYIKLGQYLAIRYDLLPSDVCNELARLMNEASPLQFEEVRRCVERETGRPLESVFSSFDQRAIGSASIAQVHRAVSLDGQLLAVKVQRPGIENLLRSDFRNMRRMARLIDRLGWMGAISLRQTVEEVAEFTLRELDFRCEGRTADQISEDSPAFVKVPAIRWGLTTQRLLVMEFVEGVSLLHICELGDRLGEATWHELLPAVNPEEVVERLAEACLSQLFITGRFHGDPHFANVFVNQDGTVSFVDFGIFGSLTNEQRMLFADLMEAMTAGLSHKAFACYARLAYPTALTNMRQFRQEMIHVLRNWHSSVAYKTGSAEDRLAVSFQTQVLTIMRRNHVSTGPDQILFWRTLGWLDIMANRLPGDFDMLGTMLRFFRRHRPSAMERSLAVLLAPSEALMSAWAMREVRLEKIADCGLNGSPLQVRVHQSARRRLEPVAALVFVAFAALAAGALQ